MFRRTEEPNDVSLWLWSPIICVCTYPCCYVWVLSWPLFAEDKSKVKKRNVRTNTYGKELAVHASRKDSVGPSIFATDIDLHLPCRSRSGNATCCYGAVVST